MSKLRQDVIDKVRKDAAQDRKNAEKAFTDPDKFLRDRLAYLTARWKTYDFFLPEDIETLRIAFMDGAKVKP